MADRTLSIRITGDTKDLSRALGTAGKDADGFGTKAHSAAKLAAVGFAGLAAGHAAIDFMKDAAKAAAEDQSALSRAGLAVKNAKENWDKLEKPIDSSISKMSEQSGFIKSDLLSAFSKLETATGDHVKALKLEHDAMNLAAQRNISLSAATKILSNSYLGSATAARRVGVVQQKLTTDTDAVKKKFEQLALTQNGKLTPAQKHLEKAQLDAAKASDKQRTATSLLDKIHKAFAGGVEERSKTMAGKLAIFQAKWEEIKVKVGQVVLPLIISALGDLMTAFDDLSSFVEHNKRLVEALGVVIGTVVVGVLAYETAVKAAEVAQKLWSVATGVATAAQWLWNAALDANPIGVVVIAIGVLVAALVVLYTQSDTVRGIINDIKDNVLPVLSTAFDTVKSAAQTAFGFISDTVIPALKTAFDAAKTAAETAFGFVTDTVIPALKTAFDGAKTVVETVGTAIGTAVGGIKTAVKDSVGFITDTVIPALNTAWGTIQPVIDPLLAYLSGPFNVAFDAVKGVINVVKDLLNGDFSQAWTDIKTVIKNVLGDIDTALSGIPGKLATAAKNALGDAKNIGENIVTGILNGLGGLLSALVGAVQGAVTSALNTVTGGLLGDGTGNNTTGRSGGHFKGGVTVKGATGGIVTRPTFALIGEAGPEAVVPLSSTAGSSALGAGGGVTVIVNGWVGNDQDIAERVRNELIRMGRRTTGGALGGFA